VLKPGRIKCESKPASRRPLSMAMFCRSVEIGLVGFKDVRCSGFFSAPGFTTKPSVLESPDTAQLSRNRTAARQHSEKSKSTICDLSRGLRGMIEDQDRAASFCRLQGAHQARCACPDYYYVFLHGLKARFAQYQGLEPSGCRRSRFVGVTDLCATSISERSA
jgi:hypothetical protein